jgi:ubiquitin carboxyl-terminal hydrolase 7
VEGAIAGLFEGKSEAFIECINVPYKSSRTESFYDLSLNVKGLQDLKESFAQYIEMETLEGVS